MNFCACSMFVLLSAGALLALPTVQFEKSVSASVLGGSVEGSNKEVVVNVGGSGGSVAGASAAAFAASSSAAAGADAAVTFEKEVAYGHKTIPQKTEIVAEATFTEAPKVISERTIQGQAHVQRTVIEKTVIPQYVEKTIQVPSYVEKTIRVPTVVEHKVRVPVTPKVVEKTYEEGGAVGGVGAHAHAHAGLSAGGMVQLQERPHVYTHKQFGLRTNAAGASSSGAAASSASYVGSGTTAGNVHVTGYKSGALLGNILNIPIATLGAVGNLFNSFGNAGASVSFSKQYGTY